MEIKNYLTVKNLLVAVILFVSYTNSNAQAENSTGKQVTDPTKETTQAETKDQKILKNTIRFNITNPLIFGESFIIGYERIVRPNQSFSINVGSFSLPKMSDLDLGSEYNVERTGNKGGYNIAGDYRFYLSKVNRYDAPRGVYIGPYVSLSQSKRSISLTSTGVVGQFDAGYTFRASTFGFQFGYQFVFWRRVSLDMILMGPGISAYSIKTELSTTLDPAKEEELFQKINDAIAAKIPGYDKVIEPGTMKRGDTFNTTSAGYRYVVMLGFRF